MKIGIFDSGIGGLSVLHCARKLMPNADFIYYADEKNVPYGEKQPKEIRTFLEDILHFLLDQNVDAIVVACNTATCVMTMEYRKQFPVPIIGMEPAVKKAVDLYSSDNKRILVAATPITIRGKKLKDLVLRCDTNQEVDLIALPGLVRLAEKSEFKTEEVEQYLKEALWNYRLEDYGTVVLGCTHFNYFKESFRTLFGPEIHFLDGNEGTIRQLMRVLKKQQEQQANRNTNEPCVDSQNAGQNFHKCGSVEYYFSGNAVGKAEQARIDQYLQQLEKVYSIN